MTDHIDFVARHFTDKLKKRLLELPVVDEDVGEPGREGDGEGDRLGRLVLDGRKYRKYWNGITSYHLPMYKSDVHWIKSTERDVEEPKDTESKPDVESQWVLEVNLGDAKDSSDRERLRVDIENTKRQIFERVCEWVHSYLRKNLFMLAHRAGLFIEYMESSDFTDELRMVRNNREEEDESKMGFVYFLNVWVLPHERNGATLRGEGRFKSDYLDSKAHEFDHDLIDKLVTALTPFCGAAETL